ncbi:uncharacterized protein BDR25DRAFT_114406 [Lindgomyces ingoldianus]|uniref:Uncharacterized protein n=1 Tax=Lindgomyces ingoldianus TaxID=673940 RepID=A0ACB6Q8X1_9PLEO|nr:uncharacterized protein BDR25DRAFT_114406 [Lindgomyces ingoldianus]KAF2463384.1 hypothetical protein BDR25DRAFT_114406 [Lindgomyces ingoldianus]
MSHGSGTRPVMGGATQPRFPQTASWNMFEIARVPYEATLGLLARYMAGRVNPYTGAVVQCMSSQFWLSRHGRQNIESAISSLNVVGSAGDVLEFGFAIEDVIRSFSKTEAGATGLALCAALKECYHDDIAIDVLLEMARLCKASPEFMPTSSHWKDWLTACAGVLAVTDFPRRAEHLMQLPNSNQRLGVYQRFEGLPKALRSCSSPQSIAKCLFALASITRNELEAVTFVGGADAGWLAAVAEWFFELRVTMEKSDGEMFYCNHTDPDSVQVKIVFQDNAEQTSTSLQCVGRAYILEDVSRILDGSLSPSAVVVSGRLDWKEALTRTFQLDFEELMNIPNTFGELLGSASRIFKALAEGHSSFPDLIKLACTGYSDDSFGPGLVASTLQWFPELKKLKKYMQEGVRYDLKKARKTYEFCISKIRSHCGCRTCQSTSTGFEFADKRGSSAIPSHSVSADGDEMLTDSGSHQSLETDPEDDWDPDQFCQVIIAETIIYLSRVLGSVFLESDALLPVRSGLARAYGRQLNQRRSAHLGRGTIEAIGQIAFCLDFDNNFSISMQEGYEEAVEIRLHSVLEIFSGQRALSSSISLSAASNNRIVAFLGVLREPSVDQNAVARIHVVPGRIYHEKKRYEALVDRALLKRPASNFGEVEQIARTNQSFWQTTLRARESSHGLECLLDFGSQKDYDNSSIHQIVSVGPSRLAVVLASRRGLVSCKWARAAYRGKPPSGPSCISKRSNYLLSPNEAQEAWQMNPHHVEIQNKAISIIRPTTNDTAIAMIASVANLDPECSLYLVSSECLQCCVETAIQVDRPERSRFCFIYLPC